MISVEALCHHYLYVWNRFCCRPEINNDLTLVESSPSFNDILTRSFFFHLSTRFNLRGIQERKRFPYVFVDVIYQNWKICLQRISVQRGRIEQMYTKCQERVGKDIERCFCILQELFCCLLLETIVIYRPNNGAQPGICKYKYHDRKHG